MIAACPCRGSHASARARRFCLCRRCAEGNVPGYGEQRKQARGAREHGLRGCNGSGQRPTRETADGRAMDPLRRDRGRGRRYDHDVVIDKGKVAKRGKKPSKAYRGEFGHTPLSAAESIPWGGKRLIVGTGESGSLPIMPDVWQEAKRRGIELIAEPTEKAWSWCATRTPKTSARSFTSRADAVQPHPDRRRSERGRRSRSRTTLPQASRRSLECRCHGGGVGYRGLDREELVLGLAGK